MAVQARTFSKRWWRMWERQEYAWAKYSREKYDPHHGEDEQGFIDLAKHMRRVNWGDDNYMMPDGKIYRDLTYCWYMNFRPIVTVRVRVCLAEVDRSTITFFEVLKPYRHYTFGTQALEYVLRDAKVKYAIVFRGDTTLMEFYRKKGKFFRPPPKRFFTPRKIIMERKVIPS